MASNRETKKVARDYFLSTPNVSLTEVAAKYSINKQTLYKWARKEEWKKLKAAQVVSKTNSIANAHKLLDNLLIKSLKMSEDGTDTAKIINEISQVNKTIETLTGQIPLDTVINVLEAFLNSIPHGHKSKSFNTDRQLIAEYQQQYLIDLAAKMGIDV